MPTPLSPKSRLAPLYRARWHAESLLGALGTAALLLLGLPFLLVGALLDALMDIDR